MSFLGIPDIRRRVPLVVALGVDAVGTGVSGPLLLLFLIKVVGLPVGQAGILLTGAGLASLAVPALAGRLIARWGGQRVVIAAQVAQAVAMLGFLLARDVAALVICALIAGIGQRAFWSSVFGVIADAADDARGPEVDQDSWFALTGMVQNAGFALGALSAGALLLLPGDAPYLVALGVNAVSFAGSALLLVRQPSRHRVPVTDHPRTSGHVLRDRPYLLLIVANTLFAFCSTILGVGIAVYALDALRAPTWLIGVLLALNTIVGATCQGIAVRASSRIDRVRVLVLAGVLWAVWGVATAALTQAPPIMIIPGLIASVLVYSTAELLHAPRSMGLAADAAPPEHRAEYLSWFQYSFAIATVTAPGVFALAFGLDARLPWLVTSVIALLACGGTVLADRARGSSVGR